MSLTYEKNGKKHSHYAGRSAVAGESMVGVFFEGYKVERNDMGPNDTIDYSKTDCVVTSLSGAKLFVEAEAKADSLWRYIYEGTDIPARKEKLLTEVEDLSNYWHFMVKMKAKNEVLLTNFAFLKAASESQGYMGTRNIQSSKNWKMPSHGCHMVRKRCRTQGEDFEENDFIRIPYKYINHWKLEEGRWKAVQTPCSSAGKHGLKWIRDNIS